MKRNSQNGFSLIELLIVVVIIGILAAIAIPSLLQARIAAENRSAVALLSTIRSSQMAFYAQKGRYGRLDELQQSQNGSLGDGWLATSGQRGRFTYTLTRPTPLNDLNLKSSFEVTAIGVNYTGSNYVYILNQSGEILNIDGP